MSNGEKNAVPWVSKTRLNLAGQHIRDHALNEDDIHILEQWRAGHKHVLNTFQALLRTRKKKRKIEVAQRFKRRWTIADKLIREPGMQLARMDDVAGCRLIFLSIKALNTFRKEMHAARFSHKRRNDVDKYDYIKHPKASGYRSIHDIYEYNTSSKVGMPYNGLLLELQYRTKVQHAWATAVEVVSRLTENQPKFDRGDERYKEFFRLTSEIIARVHENCNSCYPDFPDRELVERYVSIDGEIGLYHMLKGLTAIQLEDIGGGNLILRFTQDGQLRIHRVPRGKAPTEMYFEIEDEYREDDIVLVRADTFKEIRSAYRNYFSDTNDFLIYVNEGCKALT